MSFNSNELLAQILDKLNKQEDILNALTKRIDLIENNKKDIKMLRYLTDDDDYNRYINKEKIIKYMELHSIKGDAKLFKMIYLDYNDSNDKTIKFNGKNKFEYKTNDNKWHADAYGVKIRNKFLKNLRNIYYKYNTMERYKNNSEMFISNQVHITKLLDSRYQTQWINEMKLLL